MAAERRCIRCNCILRSGNLTGYCAVHYNSNSIQAMQARAREVLGDHRPGRIGFACEGSGRPRKKVS